MAFRKPKKTLGDADFPRMVAWFRKKSFGETADLACILEATGLRVSAELLRHGAIRVEPGDDDAKDVVLVRGKHPRLERAVPVVDPEARLILASRARMKALRGVNYGTHLWRWNAARRALRITAPLQALRHRFAAACLAMTGGNGELVQAMLGHASIKTTANYLGLPLSAIWTKPRVRTIEAKARARAKTLKLRAIKSAKTRAAKLQFPFSGSA